MTETPTRDVIAAVERFLESSLQPVLSEPGEECLRITPENFVIELRNGCAQLQAWDQSRNLVRRVTAIQRESRGRLALKVARFGKSPGTIELVDQCRQRDERLPLRSNRLQFREQFRRFLRREFPSYKLVELSTEADLEHSLSPAYPRALLRQGTSAWAAIGAAADSVHPDGVLTFGLIWLDYLRRREPTLAIHGLALYLPLLNAKTTCLRLLFLDPAAAMYRAFSYDDQGFEEALDLHDYGNLDTHLDPEGHGHPVHRMNLHHDNPEALLEFLVRAQIQEIDASLLPAPVYGQVPAFAATHRGILDLLAVDNRGRLAVIELKAAEDIHLPLQALDYWMRVAWHVERNEFRERGYFPASELRREAPRLLLVSPALDIHPCNERVLRYFSPRVPVERLGVGLQWRQELKVVFRS